MNQPSNGPETEAETILLYVGILFAIAVVAHFVTGGRWF